MIPQNESFNGTYPYAPHFSQAPGFKMHYVDEGTGPILLCLHGEPTWGYLYRHFIAGLSGSHRVIVPDHMGFGKTETPQDRTYWLQDHIDNLVSLVLELDLQDITLVLHDFGGPVGMGLAIRHPDRISRIVSVNGPTPLGQPDLIDKFMASAGESPWFQWILGAERAGRLESVFNELEYSILSTLKLNGFERNDLITDNWLAAYGAAFPTPESAKGALGWARGFATDAHQFEIPSEAVKTQISRLPALAIWGTKDRTLQSRDFLPLFRAAFPRGLVHELTNAGHYSPEDAPETILPLVRQFLTLTAP